MSRSIVTVDFDVVMLLLIVNSTIGGWGMAIAELGVSWLRVVLFIYLCIYSFIIIIIIILHKILHKNNKRIVLNWN